MMIASGSRGMGTPFFHELKKQASFFFREKIKNARLALTDVTPAQLLTEEATNGMNPWPPDAKTMGFISRAAFEVDDYWRIVEILHKRLSKFDRKMWREAYHALMLLEHLLTHGPESTAEEFRCDIDVIEDIANFHYIDERGFNWGSTVGKKSERILKLLEKGTTLLKEERKHARKISRGIQGFGSSINYRFSSDNNSSVDSSSTDDHRGLDRFRKCNSQPEQYYEGDEEDHGLVAQEVLLKEISSLDEVEKEKLMKEELVGIMTTLPPPTKCQLAASQEESRALLVCEPKLELHKEDHPFDNVEQYQSMESMLLLSLQS